MRPLVLLLAALALVGACTTRVVETSRAPGVSGPGTAAGITHHGFADGELILRLTPEGERAVSPAVGQPPTRLRFGVPSLDRLNAKYRATAIVPIAGATRAYRLQVSPDANILRAVDEYGREPLVAEAAPNYLLRIPVPAEAPEAVRTTVE